MFYELHVAQHWQLCTCAPHKWLIMGSRLWSLGFRINRTQGFRSSNGLLSPILLLLTTRFLLTAPAREQLCASQRSSAHCLLQAGAEQFQKTASCALVLVLWEATSLPPWRLTPLWHQQEPEQLLWPVEVWRAPCAHRGALRSHGGHRSTQFCRGFSQFKPVQTNSDSLIQIRLVQTKSNWFKMVQTSLSGSKLFWRAQNSSNPFKLDENTLNRLRPAQQVPTVSSWFLELQSKSSQFRPDQTGSKLDPKC